MWYDREQGAVSSESYICYLHNPIKVLCHPIPKTFLKDISLNHDNYLFSEVQFRTFLFV